MNWPYPPPPGAHKDYPWWKKTAGKYTRYDKWKIITSAKTVFTVYNDEGKRVESYAKAEWKIEDVMIIVDDMAPLEKPQPHLLQFWEDPDGDLFKIDGFIKGTPYSLWPEAGLASIIKKWDTWPPPRCRLVKGLTQWGEDCRWAPH
jgi:hypothetical protein